MKKISVFYREMDKRVYVTRRDESGEVKTASLGPVTDMICGDQRAISMQLVCDEVEQHHDALEYAYMEPPRDARLVVSWSFEGAA